MDVDPQALISAAQAVRRHAYAPYSSYLVGAAVLDEQGRIHAGCNVENISFGLTLCAERSAIARMIAEGGREVRAAAVVTKDGGTPCGMCRQTLAEFAAENAAVPVFCASDDGQIREYDLRELLPAAFDSDVVERTPSGPEGST